MKKTAGNATVRELKAAALDRLVKAELSKKQAAQTSKMSHLRALRLARDAAIESDESDPQKREPAQSRLRPKRISVPTKARRAIESSDDGI
jgi:hypothetical protein